MTKKKTRRRLRLIDILVVIVCLSVCAYSINLFWKDLNSSTTRTDKDEIATIVFKQRIAQRKFSDRVVWERLQNTSPLYNADMLRTSAQSEATITFKNGAKIELHENTMLQIFYSEDEGIKVSVDGGDIEVDTSNIVDIPESTSRSPFDFVNRVRNVAESNNSVVQNGGLSVQMTNGAVVTVEKGSKLNAASNAETGIVSFNLQEGNAKLTAESDTEKTPVTLTKGEIAKVEKDGEVSKGEFAVTSISKNLRVLNFEEKKSVPVELEWKATEELKDKPVIIETSRKKDFSVIENEYKVENDQNFTLPVETGTLYWRAKVEDSATESEGRIRVDAVKPVVGTAPANGASISYRNELPRIVFNWQGDSLAANYRLEVSKTPDFENIVLSDEVTAENAVYSTLDSGNYYWRVTPYYSVNETGWTEPSMVSNFTVIQREAVTPPNPTIPVQNAILTYQAKDFNVNFQWKSEIKNARYYFAIAKDKDFKEVVYNTTQNENRVFKNFSENLPVGEYYWKVIRYSDEEESGSTSEVKHFSVIKYVPGENRLVYPPDNFQIEDFKFASTNFMWKLADEYKNTITKSILQFSSDSDFKNVVNEISTENQNYTNIKLKTGKYYWRIGVYNSFEDSVVFTKPRAVTVLDKLGATKITFPVMDSLSVAMKNTPVKIQWDKVPGADFYKVTVVDLSKGETVVYDKQVKTNSVSDFKVPDTVNVKETTFTVTVQPFSEQTELSPMRQGKSVSTNFRIRTPSSVKLVSPSDNKRFDGLTALRKPIVLEWEPDLDKPARATVVVRKVLSNGSTKEVQRFTNAKNQVSLTRLPTGSYQWSVYASSSEGLPLDAGVYNSFVVTGIQKLNAPNLNEPKNNFVMGPDYLRKNRSLSFSWKAVSGATDYSFTLYQRKSDGSIRQIYTEKNIKGTSVKFKNLAELDIGDFEWKVTAYCHAKDGFEEQSGNTATGKFKIQFELPSAVKINDPGKVYGN